ncbi:MAG TPA: methionyl-tRNA formyltransferase [Candidatus Berkiella sp.]|nr:methionyl-tRNA formyltransferase [Candidatus Berkiella sp.]
MKIIFAGTPEFAQIQLEALLTTEHEIVAVYTQPDKPAGRGQQLQMSPVKTLALSHQLPVEQPTSLKTPEALATLTNYQPDVMVVAAYGLLLPEAVLTLPRYGCINIHASLLPRWRGASPIQQAILAGDKETGITLMRMDKGLDTGNSLATGILPIANDDTSESLHDKLAILGAKMLFHTLEEIVDSPGEKQNEAQVTHAPKIAKAAALINWQQSAVEIERQVRAYFPWPVAYTLIEGQILRIFKAQVVKNNATTSAPGTIIEQTPQGIIVSTQEQALLITHAQLPGKKALPMSEILKGHATLFTVSKQMGI